MSSFYIYILSNRSKTLYTGVTNNLNKRLYEHRNGFVEGFTKKYNIHKLVFFEETSDVNAAIAREKQIKGWLRKKKIALIEQQNPQWEDLGEKYFLSGDPSLCSR